MFCSASFEFIPVKHIDKDHYHNHIVINSVDLETGKKYQSNKKQRELVKEANDSICHEHGLSAN